MVLRALALRRVRGKLAQHDARPGSHTGTTVHAKAHKYQGLPPNEKANSGSKLSLLFPTDILNMAAGLLSEKDGISEIPLLVRLTAPEK